MESIWSIAESAKTSAILHPGPRNDSQHIQGLQQQVACKIRILRCLRYRMSWDHVRNHHPIEFFDRQKKRTKTRRTKNHIGISHVPSPPEPPADVPCWPRWGPAGPALRNLTSRSLAAGQCLGHWTQMKTPSMGLHQNRAVTYIQHGFFGCLVWEGSLFKTLGQPKNLRSEKGLGNGTKYEKHMWTKSSAGGDSNRRIQGILPPRHFSAKAPSISFRMAWRCPPTNEVPVKSVKKMKM